MGFSEVLSIIIKILTIILLSIFILSAYTGYVIVKDIQTTVHTRLANNEFPIPTDGIVLPAGMLPGGDKQSADQSQSQNQSNQQFDTSNVKDPQIKQYLSSFLGAMQAKNDAEAYRQLNSLDAYLAQKQLTQAQAKLQDVKAALNAGNNDAAQKSFSDLISLLS